MVRGSPEAAAIASCPAARRLPYFAGPEHAGPERIGPERIGPERIGPERIGHERIGPEGGSEPPPPSELTAA
jgi:serine/threonine-protein kinase